MDPHTATAHDAHHTRPENDYPRAEGDAVKSASLNRTALSATIHCLAGCAVGEVAGMIIGTALGLGTAVVIVLAVGLAFVTGYAFTIFPLLRAGVPLKRAPAKKTRKARA